MLGIGRARFARGPVDAHFRMRPDALEAAIVADRESGLRPVAVVANGGTIVTGAIDPLRDRGDRAEPTTCGCMSTVRMACREPRRAGEVRGPRRGRLGVLGRAQMALPTAGLWRAALPRPAGRRRAFSFAADYAKPLSDDPVEGPPSSTSRWRHRADSGR